MKTAVIAAIVLVLAALWTPAARAWNCSDPNAERVDVGSTLPAGATAGDGDGQYYKGTDAANPNDYYVCQVVKPTPATTPTGGNSNANSQSSSQANSASNSASNSSATGGKATSSSGSTAAGGNATGGSSSAGISNAGNSISTNTNTASGGAGGSASATGGNQHQSQSNTLSGSGNSTATASGNGVGNGNNSNNYSNTTNIPAAAASPYAPPVFSSATCFKGFSGGATAVAGGISFGGGKIDQNCAALEAARQAPNLLSFCKQYIQVKYVKNAGVTLEDCMQPKAVTPVVVQPPTRVAPDVQPIVVNVQPVVVPAPVVNFIAPAPAPSIVVHATPAKPRVPHSNNKCVPHECPKTKPTVWNEDMVEGLRSKG